MQDTCRQVAATCGAGPRVQRPRQGRGLAAGQSAGATGTRVQRSRQWRGLAADQAAIARVTSGDNCKLTSVKSYYLINYYCAASLQ